MDGKKAIAGILIVVGIILAFYGINELNSLSSKVMSFAGQTNTGAYAAIFVGGLLGIVGIVLLFQSHPVA